MAPKARKKRLPLSDPEGMFAGMVVFFVANGVQPRRLQIWKQKLEQMGASVEDRMSKKVTHVFAMNSDALLQEIGRQSLLRYKGTVLLYQWLEDSLRLGERVFDAPYILTLESGGGASANKSPQKSDFKAASGHDSSGDETSRLKKIRTSQNELKTAAIEDVDNAVNVAVDEAQNVVSCSYDMSPSPSPVKNSPPSPEALTKTVGTSDPALPYCPPDQNQNITEIFGKLVNIYRALGDDRRSFSYYKAIAVIEKLPFKIESVDQVKDLPAIGRSMQDHIQEILSTRKLSKLEHFESDEKVLKRCGQLGSLGKYGALVQPLH